MIGFWHPLYRGTEACPASRVVQTCLPCSFETRSTPYRAQQAEVRLSRPVPCDLLATAPSTSLRLAYGSYRLANKHTLHVLVASMTCEERRGVQDGGVPTQSAYLDRLRLLDLPIEPTLAAPLHRRLHYARCKDGLNAAFESRLGWADLGGRRGSGVCTSAD